MCWGCNEFPYYIVRKEIMIDTDNRPQPEILEKKKLAKLPVKFQKFEICKQNKKNHACK